MDVVQSLSEETVMVSCAAPSVVNLSLKLWDQENLPALETMSQPV